MAAIQGLSPWDRMMLSRHGAMPVLTLFPLISSND